MRSPVIPDPSTADLERWLQEEIAPWAAEIDRDPAALREVFQLLGKQNLLGLKVPETLGGLGWSAVNTFRYAEQVARYSGVLAFLQTQHQSAVSALAQSDNPRLKDKYLRPAVSGKIGLGVGFSHLRRSDSPPVIAVASSGGYRVNGTVPWITGYGTFQHFLLGAQLPDDRVLFALTPFREIEQASGALVLSEPMALAAMQSTQTVTATLTDWFVPNNLVLDIKPAGWIQARDRLNPLSHSCFALGCAQAGLDVLQRAQNPVFPAIAKTYRILEQEFDRCRSETYAALTQVGDGNRLDLRAWAIELAVRCAHAAVAASRGAANYSHHPAQRIYREALAFTVFGQNTDVMNATLKRVAMRSASPLLND